MAVKRKHLSLETRLASALLTIVRPGSDGFMAPVIPFEMARTMTNRQIIAHFRFDHCVIPHAEGGSDEAWNLAPIPTKEHDKKTAMVDVPGIAKRKRVAKGHIEHTRIMQTPRDQREPKRSKWASRPFPKKEKKNDTTRGRRST